MSEAVADGVHIVGVPVSHADAARLVEEVQQEYVVRYGGHDDTPLDQAAFDPGRGAFFVGYAGGRPVVSGAWRWVQPPDGVPWGAARCAEVKRMYVVPAARGLGHARQMLAHLEADAAAHGAEVVVLETGLSQPEAIGLYTSSGYRPIPTYGHYRCSPSSRCFGKRLSH